MQQHVQRALTVIVKTNTNSGSGGVGNGHYTPGEPSGKLSWTCISRGRCVPRGLLCCTPFVMASRTYPATDVFFGIHETYLLFGVFTLCKNIAVCRRMEEHVIDFSPNLYIQFSYTSLNVTGSNNLKPLLVQKGYSGFEMYPSNLQS